MSTAVGVVVPTLNEAAALPALAQRLREIGVPASGVVVADCASDDGTPEVAGGLGLGVIGVARDAGRGGALRAGESWWMRAADPPGVVWFVHADTAPPSDALSWMRRVLDEPGRVAGAFEFRLDRSGVGWWARRTLRAVTYANRVRYRISGVHFGDQCLFVRAEALRAIGGVPDPPILEDVLLCRRLRAQFGRRAIGLARGTAVTSARRFLRHGIVRQALRDWGVLLALRLGVSPRRLCRGYNRDNRGAPGGGRPAPKRPGGAGVAGR
ncbi:MAG: glycosyltransferase [Planctomycetota bacterium]